MTDQNRREARDVCEPTRHKTTRMVCADCGRPYYNLWAHLEECSGKTVRQVDLTDEQLEHFKQIHDRRDFWAERGRRVIAVGQVWALNTNGERWRIEQDRGNGEYLVRALDGPHKGKTDAVFGAEIRSGATLEQTSGPQSDRRDDG